MCFAGIPECLILLQDVLFSPVQMSGASFLLSVLCPPRSSRFKVTLSSYCKSLVGSQFCNAMELDEPSLQKLRFWTNLPFIDQAQNQAVSSLYPLLLLFWSCCSHAHSIVTTQQYATVCCPPTHSVLLCLALFTSSSSLSLSLTPSPSLLFLPLSSLPGFMHAELELGGEREREQGRDRERGSDLHQCCRDCV